jgi:hypothetical protein
VIPHGLKEPIEKRIAREERLPALTALDLRTLILLRRPPSASRNSATLASCSGVSDWRDMMRHASVTGDTR